MYSIVNCFESPRKTSPKNVNMAQKLKNIIFPTTRHATAKVLTKLTPAALILPHQARPTRKKSYSTLPSWEDKLKLISDKIGPTKKPAKSEHHQPHHGISVDRASLFWLPSDSLENPFP
jgi:hypothetical protein